MDLMGDILQILIWDSLTQKKKGRQIKAEMAGLNYIISTLRLSNEGTVDPWKD